MGFWNAQIDEPFEIYMLLIKLAQEIAEEFLGVIGKGSALALILNSEEISSEIPKSFWISIYPRVKPFRKKGALRYERTKTRFTTFHNILV